MQLTQSAAHTKNRSHKEPPDSATLCHIVVCNALPSYRNYC